MRGALFLLLAAAAVAAGADPHDLHRHSFVPGAGSVNATLSNMLDELGRGARPARGISVPQARRNASRIITGSCAADDYACQAAASVRRARRSSPQAPGRLDPMIREYVLDPKSSSARCARAGMRKRDPIWQIQSCRRDQDFGALAVEVNSSDVYARASGSGDAIAIEAGSVGDNYWFSNVFERSIEFDLDSLVKFKSFAITELSFDDWILISVNDKTVYVGPYGGDRLHVPWRGRVCYTSSDCSGWELGESWHRRPNIDLLPHLRVGSNRIQARVVVGGGGEFHMRLLAVHDSDYLAARSRAGTLQRCSNLRAAGCRRAGEGACLFAKGGVCRIKAQKYHCPQRNPQHQVVSCPIGEDELCPDGICSARSDASHASDLAAAVTALETGRQASTYLDAARMRIFAGTAAVCRDKIAWGAADCCRPSAAGRNRANAALLAGLGMRAVKRGVPSAGSKHVFDVLYAEDLQTSLSGILSSLPGASQDMKNLFSYYGVQVRLGSSGLALSFDPSSFALMVATSVIAELLSCNKQEQLLGMRLGAGLCSKHDERCSGLGCRTEREYYCCYNSVIARQVATQGWRQLGQPAWRAGGCPGFTPQQFARIDFAAIDLREFIASVATVNDPAARLRGYRGDSEAALRNSIRNGRAAVEIGDD